MSAVHLSGQLYWHIKPKNSHSGDSRKLTIDSLLLYHVLQQKYFNSTTMASQDKVYEDVNKIKKNIQGGKTFGAQLSAFEKELDAIGTEYLAGNADATQADVDKYKAKFLIYDEDRSGDISLDELKRMMEKLGKAVTHTEAVKMISQVDTVGKGTIHYKYVHCSAQSCSFSAVVQFLHRFLTLFL